MTRTAPNPPASRSWKDIRQGVSPRAMSRAGRKRARLPALRFALLAVFVFGCAWGGFVIHNAWKNNPRLLIIPAETSPLRAIEFATDGVLDHEWLRATLALPAGAGLSELDLRGMLARLLASGQVESAVLTPNLSRNTLRVTLEERTPVVRLKLPSGEVLLVARDGIVYAGAGHSAADIERLPWLDGVSLKPAGAPPLRRGYEPVPDMERVADLLAAARSFVPRLYAGWRVVSLARLASDQEIVVRSGEIARIVFNARADFLLQLAELGHIVDVMQQQTPAALAGVNFTAGGQVAVELAASAPEKPASRALPSSSSLFQPRL